MRLHRVWRDVARAGLSLALLMLPAKAASQTTPFRISDGFRQTYDRADWTFGTYFLANADVSVYSLGLWLPTGSSFNDLLTGDTRFIDNDWMYNLGSSYEVGLYNDGMVQLGQATIRPDLSTVRERTANGQVWYTALGAPLQMLTGQRYYLLAAASPGQVSAKDIPNIHPMVETLDSRFSDYVAVQGGDHISQSDGLHVGAFVRFIGPGRLGPTMLLSDPITNAPILNPEPATLALMLGGSIVIGAAARRRRRPGSNV